MDYSDQHQMIVVNSYTTGAQEWYCPSCGRHFILQWPPNYKRIILEEGDKQAAHAGGSGEYSLETIDIQPARPASDPVESQSGMQRPVNFINKEDPYLLPWLRWIGDRDF